MNHVDLANDVAGRLGISRENAKQLLFLVLASMFEGLVVDGELDIAGFGRIRVYNYPGRKMRNPQTGVLMHSKDSITFRFKAHQKLLDEIRSVPIPGRGGEEPI